MTKNTECQFCNKPTVLFLHRQRFMNGSEHFVWVCSTCKRFHPSTAGGMYIPKEKVHSMLSAQKIEELPVLMPDACNRCVVCGSRECELHHWAPKFLFGTDADNWPKDYLCPTCHGLWHSAVTPQLKESNEH